jgi:hypothetical protein
MTLSKLSIFLILLFLFSCNAAANSNSELLSETFLYPNSSVGYYGKLLTEMIYGTGFLYSDINTFNSLSCSYLEKISINDTDYISLDKTAANDGYLYVNFTLDNVESVNHIIVRTLHYRNFTNPVILGLFNKSSQKWQAVNSSTVETIDVEMNYNISGMDLINYTTLNNNTLSLSVSLNTNGDENEDVFINLIEVYINYTSYEVYEVSKYHKIREMLFAIPTILKLIFQKIADVIPILVVLVFILLIINVIGVAIHTIRMWR